MEVDDDDELPVRFTASSLEECTTKLYNSEEEEILNLLRRTEDQRDTTAASNNPNDVLIAEALDSQAERGQESQAAEPSIHNPNVNDDGNPESRQAAQPDPAERPPQRQRQRQIDPDDPLEAPVPNLRDFLAANDNRLDDDEIAELQRRITTIKIAQSLARYRRQGVPEEDLELILIPHTAAGNFITRGAWFGAFVLLSVLVLFILQMQVMVGFTTENVDITFDELMYELLEVRHFSSHVRECHVDKSVQDTIPVSPFSMDEECNTGVLHIPALYILRDTHLYPQSNHLMRFRQGINLTWRMPCQTPNRALIRDNDCSAFEETGVCTMEDTMCFRGVHDNVVQTKEVRDALNFAKELIADGNDHFDVFLAGRLEQKLPELVIKLRSLLADVYSIHQIEPFAFRMLSAGPMDGFGVDRDDPYLNLTNYMSWVRRNKKINDHAKPSIPWPFRWEPVRDQCLLLSDMEADPNFSIYTSVFLTTGAGFDFRGGTTLYIDDDDATLGSKRRSKIKRGLVIDGSEGRVIVSTGGLENKRCRLPIREGVRTELQIWWDASPSG